MSANLAALLYLVSGALFIMALRGLSSPATSRQGNMYGMVGMAIAIVTTLATMQLSPMVIGLVALGLPLWGAAQVLNAPYIAVYRFGIYAFAFMLGYFVFAQEEVIERLAAHPPPFCAAALALGIFFNTYIFAAAALFAAGAVFFGLNFKKKASAAAQAMHRIDQHRHVLGIHVRRHAVAEVEHVALA